MPEEVKGVAPYNTNNSDFNAISFVIQQAIREQVNTCIVCKVVARSGAYVDVLPLVTQISGKGEAIQPTTLYKLPYMRYHAWGHWAGLLCLKRLLYGKNWHKRTTAAGELPRQFHGQRLLYWRLPQSGAQHIYRAEANRRDCYHGSRRAHDQCRYICQWEPEPYR